jgi:hypothetical protein
MGHLELLRRHGRRRPFEARLRDGVGEAVELSDAYISAGYSGGTEGDRRGTKGVRVQVRKGYGRGTERVLKGYSRRGTQRALKAYSVAFSTADSRAVERSNAYRSRLACRRRRAPPLAHGLAPRPCTLKAASGSTEVGDAHVPAALHLAQQHVRRLDVAMRDLRAFGAHSNEGGRKSRCRRGRSAVLYGTQFKGEA